jgi:hypothetical protein
MSASRGQSKAGEISPFFDYLVDGQWERRHGRIPCRDGAVCCGEKERSWTRCPTGHVGDHEVRSAIEDDPRRSGRTIRPGAFGTTTGDGGAMIFPVPVYRVEVPVPALSNSASGVPCLSLRLRIVLGFG